MAFFIMSDPKEDASTLFFSTRASRSMSLKVVVVVVVLVLVLVVLVTYSK